MRYIRFPFGFGPNGRVATVDGESDELIDQRLIVLMTERLGERQLVPGFGTPDPTFDTIDPELLRAAVAQFGPFNVVIQDVTIKPTSEGKQNISVDWRRESTEEAVF